MFIVHRHSNPLMVSVLATGLLTGLFTGGNRATHAQSVLFNNVDTIATGLATTTIPAPGASVTRTFGSGDSYYINSANSSDATVKDAGQGVGADIRLTVAGNGIRLISNQNSTVNVGNDTYTFYTTIRDIASGQSGVLYTTFALNTRFLEGSSLTSANLISFGSVQNGALGGNLLVLGNNVYTASNFAFTPPSAPPATGGTSLIDGAFSEHITAFSGTVPEPGPISLVAGIGVSGTLIGLRRRKR